MFFFLRSKNNFLQKSEEAKNQLKLHHELIKMKKQKERIKLEKSPVKRKEQKRKESKHLEGRPEKLWKEKGEEVKGLIWV